MPTAMPDAPYAAASASAETVTRLRAVIHGHVQGVGYRYWTHHTAQRFGGLSGVVRNRVDGAVEVEAESPGQAYLEAFLHELHVGPEAAQVTSVEASWEQGVAPRYTGALRVG